MRFRCRWVSIILLMMVLTAACDSAPSGVAARPTLTAASPPTGMPLPAPTATTAGGAPASLAWSQYDSNGAIQVWVAAAGGAPRLLVTIPTTGGQCPLVSAGIPMLSPDLRHVLVGLGQRCNDLIADPGPLAVIDTASGQMSYVPLPTGATVLPQVRSYGWVDTNTIFAITYNTAVGAFVYSLGASSATRLAGLSTPQEGVVRGSTLFYLEVTSGSGGIQSILRRYDLTTHHTLSGGISLGAYGSCYECPYTVISPGWDVASDGSHVVYQFTIPGTDGGIASSKIVYARADGSGAAQIAQYLATDAMIHLRLAPDGARVAITAAFPSPAVVTACVGSPGTKGDPCFHTYAPDAVSIAAWAPDGRSFVAATVDASYGQDSTSPGALIHYTLGTIAGQSLVAGGYAPWSNP